MKITIITAVYNNRETISDTINSVIGQDYPDIEHIVIDGASTDGTGDVLNRYASSIDQLVSEPDQGIYDALNKGLALATGDVIGFLHGDDVFHDKSVASKIAAAFSDPAVDASYGDLQYVQKDAIDRIVRHWRSDSYDPSNLKFGWMPPHPTFYVRKSVYDRLGGFNTRYRIAADYDCMLRFLATGKIHAAYIPHVLVKMRMGGVSNQSLKSMHKKSREDLEILRANNVGGLGTLLMKNARKIPQFLRR